MRALFTSLSIALVLAFASGAAFATSTCSNNVCGTIVCAGSCIQQAVNGVCVVNRCARTVDSLVDEEQDANLSLNCPANTISGSNSVSGCGNVVSGVNNVVSGNFNTVSGVGNFVSGSCNVVSGVGGSFTENYCR